MRAAATVLLLSAHALAHAQNATITGIFPTIDLGVDLTERWSANAYLFDAIKTGDDGSLNARIPGGSFYGYVELGITRHLGDRLSATAAYVREQQFPFEPTARIEHRLFQQLTLKGQRGRMDAKLRLRFDERWIRAHDEASSIFNSRLRLLGGMKWPNDTRAYLTGYFEGFLTTTGDLSHDETWATAQLGLKLGGVHAVEAGLLYIDWRMPYGWLHQYYAQVTWVMSINMRNQ